MNGRCEVDERDFPMPITVFGIPVDLADIGEFRSAQAVCSNWRELQECIHALDETDLLKCMVVEKMDRNRANILNRLYSRYSAMRKNRERRELMS